MSFLLDSLKEYLTFNRIVIIAILLAVILTYIFYIFFSNKSILVLSKIKDEKKYLKENILNLKKENEMLQKHFLDLKGLQPE
ncbi:MAG: Unknown protein [uncultured Campylobacterales bacterium]|uniref:Septum formation initiator n=1 Tax=uncultured Campylobacterales bacterium TaxID=352960 RepID=A0A6S6S9L4_9BACT|nr:MAG: Unknown protein [uncultured Campylobacterales bacterium]